jgi:putative endonuclease
MLKKKTWIVYILRCVDGSLYTGITTDLAARLKKHNQGIASKYTRSRRPVIMVWHEEVDSESTARKREAEIKRWTRIQKMALFKKTIL